MKTDRSSRPGRTTGDLGAAGDAGPTVSPSALGIPDAELTPRVQDALATLTHEVGRLRREVEQAREKLEEMARAADQDMLLPILNRRAFVREITRFTSFAERYGTPSSVVYLDLNNFKAVNDAHGHAAGDAALRHICDLILAQIRDTDVLARLGGDEFGVILAHVTAEQAQHKGASLAQALRDYPPVVDGRPVPLSFSYGVYELRAGDTPDTILQQADRAMYAQKRAAT
jgi:diguanylate cyclase (GGDEF)-like protein